VKPAQHTMTLAETQAWEQRVRYARDAADLDPERFAIKEEQRRTELNAYGKLYRAGDRMALVLEKALTLRTDGAEIRAALDEWRRLARVS